MKELLTVVSLLVSGVVGEAPYAPSGWRPDGPTLELPQRTPQKQQYLPPVDPRNIPNQYGPPETDVSVQGLPTDEQLPIFQVSPVNGQQYVGSSLNADVRTLEQRQQQLLYQQQQQIYRQFARQRELEAAANANNRFSTPQTPAQFAPRTTPSTALTNKSTEPRTTPQETTTEALDLNEGEALDDKRNKDKVSVEVSKQNIQEFPPELYLSPLAQLNLQSQYAPLQLGQIQAPVYFQPAQGLSQKQVAGYDAATHFAAFPSVLAQQQLAQQQLIQQQLVQQQLAQQQLVQAQLQQAANTQSVQPVLQPQTAQNPSYSVPRAEQSPELIPGQQVYQPVNQYQPNYDPAQTQSQYPQVQATPVILQPQYNQVQEVQKSDEEQAQQQPQFVYQGYQPQGYQPQGYQPQGYQPQGYQPQFYQPQEQPFTSSGYYPQMTSQFGNQQAQQQPFQGQDGSLQSGLDANQQGNGIDQTEDREEEDGDNGSTVTAVATAFGSRTKPRVYTVTYGVPVPRVQANPGYQTTTEANTQDEPEGPAVAEATAVSKGDKRKSAKLRNRRIRPVFTLDRSGHLVLSQDQ